jgi:hypothetical protein
MYRYMTLADWGGRQRDRSIQADRHLIDTYRGGYMYRYMTLVDWGGRQRDRNIHGLIGT